MLEARGSSNFSNIGNWVSYLKEYCLPLCISMGEQPRLFAKSPHSSEWKKHCSSCKRIINIRKKGSTTLLSIVNGVNFWKEYCLHLSFSWVRNINFGQNHRIQVNGRSTVSLVIEPLIIKARGSSTLLSRGGGVEWTFKRNTACVSGFKCEEHHFGVKLSLSKNGRITVCPVGEPQRLQERGSSTLFSSVNCVSF
jgi:hypothetical protein